ncbi:MAG: SRPBCC domain-containing protein [Lentimicrobiaceae bacterium]|jgi:uncharacterized protein YndB with AHSA1/START domain
MSTKTANIAITVRAIINAPVQKVWEYWTNPKHIIHWNNASPDWHTPRAENDLRVGGKFLSRMEARDGSMGFDFEGTYTKVKHQKLIELTLDDDRKVQVHFDPVGNKTKVTEVFEAEQENTVELQETGWQAILTNFKKYVETPGKRETLHFETSINAKVEKAYRIMFDDKSWREWTAVFNPTSHYKGSWEKGSRILFLGTDHDGKVGGMASRIKENIPNKFVSIEHLGMIRGDIEINSEIEVDDWSGAMENYTFTENNGKTLLSVELEANEEFLSYFTDTWPKALNKLKEICER